MRVFAMVAVFGCYAPHGLTGAPCDPDRPNCPFGQICVVVSGEHRCETTTNVEADASIDGMHVDASSDAPADGLHSFAYIATIAACIQPLFPSPMFCTSQNGAHQLVVDSTDSTTMQPWDAFVRFDLDAAFAPYTITNVELELTVTNANLAASNNSGVVYESTPFVAMDLMIAEPAKQSATPLAPSQGAVAKLQVVRWPLPTSLVAANGSVYLELESPSSDGANYWDLTGTKPPRLLIDSN